MMDGRNLAHATKTRLTKAPARAAGLQYSNRHYAPAPRKRPRRARRRRRAAAAYACCRAAVSGPPPAAASCASPASPASCAQMRCAGMQR